jgi:DNA-binding transcriptional regulator YhcF (GntR family)
MNLIINPEFHNLLAPLTSVELLHLRNSIIAEGCRDPLTVWQDIIIDGHNRYAICQELNIPFQVREVEFADNEAAMDWIDQNQLARRNLTPDAFKLALGRRYNRTKKTHGGDRKSSPQNEDLKTATKLAAEHGVSKSTVERAGKFAEEVEENPVFSKAIQEGVPVAKAKKDLKKKQNTEARVEAQKTITTEARKSLESVCDLRVCTCAELLISGIKPDAVITDPPYPKEFLPLFTQLAESCKFANVPLVAVMSGQSYLPEVLQRLCEHLPYRWTLAYLTPGGQAVQLWKAEVNTFWKPILLFGDSMDWLGDVVTSKVNDNDKRFHEWGQSESGMADLVERLTKPGQLVCDPFVGGGATAIAALALGRRFVGCDISADCIETTRQRIEVALCQK